MVDFKGILRGWHTLSPWLGSTSDVRLLKQVLDHEMRNGRRHDLVGRIRARMVNIRTDQIRERLKVYCAKKLKEGQAIT